MSVHTVDPTGRVTLIGALADETALLAAIEHAVAQGQRLQVIGAEFSTWELLATMRAITMLASAFDLEATWQVGINRPTATATLVDPDRPSTPNHEREVARHG
jgi:hypothetical protein